MDKYTKRGTDGSVDVEASKAEYGQALAAWCADNEIPADRIAGAVATVLDAHPGVRIPMPALLSEACQCLGSTPQTFSVLSKRVHAFVTGQATAKALFVTKGKGGGVSREAPAKKGE
jgi:hypothetical protein